MEITDVLVLRGMSDGRRVHVARLVQGYTQAEVACLATIEFRATANLWEQHEKVTPALVGFLERGWKIPVEKRAAIFKVLSLEPGDE